MKLPLAILLLATVAHADNWAALSKLESGDRDNVTGASGEISRYQMLPGVWRAETSLPFSAASNPFTARNVAILVMEKRQAHFCEVNHRMPTAGEWYRLWNKPARVINPTPAELERSKRFANLVDKN